MAGMPSARGLEWRTDGLSRQRFTEGFDNIPRNPDGSMVIEPLNQPAAVEKPSYPDNCTACTLIEGCDASNAYKSIQCRARLGI